MLVASDTRGAGGSRHLEGVDTSTVYALADEEQAVHD
jgi:hypothetical protein